MTNIVKLNYTADEINEKLGKVSDPVQITGNSEDAVMSQKAVTDEFNLVREKVESVNLFDKSSILNKNGYIIQIGNTTYTPINGFTVTHPIEAIMGSYTFHINTSQLGYNANAVVPCDANGNIVSKPLAATNNGNNTATITIDETWGATHFAVNIFNSNIDSFMVVKGGTMPSGYVQYFEPCAVIKPKALRANNPLYGKKISCNGDSICYGAGSTGGYVSFIGENNNMFVQNLGVNGSTISAETYYTDGITARHWICRTIVNMDIDADYAIVEGGVNDASLPVPLGAITNYYNEMLDDTTFYGAFESMCRQLVTRFAGKKYGYIAVHKMTEGFNSDKDEATSYYWAAKKCCEKWGVPFLDLNIAVPPFAYFKESDADLYALKEAYTYNGDGWHPNEDGYKKYYVPKIEAWLKTL